MASWITLFGPLASFVGALGTAYPRISIFRKRYDHALPAIKRAPLGFSLLPASRSGRLRKKHVNRWVLEFHTGQDVAAHAFVQQNYEPDVAQKMLSRLIDPDFGRDICICASCSPHVEDHKLQPRQGGRLCDYAVDPVKWWVEDDAKQF